MILSKLDSELFTKQVRFSEYNLIIILFVILPNWQKILGQTQILANLFAIIFFLQSKQKSFFYWLFLFCLWECFKAWPGVAGTKLASKNYFFVEQKFDNFIFCRTKNCYLRNKNGFDWWLLKQKNKQHQKFWLKV